MQIDDNQSFEQRYYKAYANMTHWWIRAVNAEEDNEHLQREIDLRNMDFEMGCEHMALKFRVRDMERALTEITGSEDGATAAEFLGGRIWSRFNIPRRIKTLVGDRIKKLYDGEWGEGAFDRIGLRRVRELELEEMRNIPRRYDSNEDEDADSEPAPSSTREAAAVPAASEQAVPAP